MATVILKCTDRCNSNCAYCEATISRSPISDMPLSTLETVFIRINDFLLKHPDEDISFTWHGGEPLLLGTEYLESALEFQQKHCPETSDRITHLMQSNLTLMTEEFVPILRKLNITYLGSSYDPDPHLRGLGPEIDTAAYNRAFLRGTGILDEHKIGWGIIYVVTSRVLDKPLPTFNLLANLRPAGGFNIQPVIISEGPCKDLAITPVEFADFLGAIFPAWYHHRDRYADVQPFAALLQNATGNGMNLLCVESGQCAKHHICIDPLGNVSQCGRSNELNIMNWGNINDCSIDELFRHETLDELERRSEFLKQNDCKDCRFFPICHGGCPIDAWEAFGTFQRKSTWCAAKKRFIEKYFEPVTGIKVENLVDYV